MLKQILCLNSSMKLAPVRGLDGRSIDDVPSDVTSIARACCRAESFCVAPMRTCTALYMFTCKCTSRAVVRMSLVRKPISATASIYVADYLIRYYGLLIRYYGLLIRYNGLFNSLLRIILTRDRARDQGPIIAPLGGAIFAYNVCF